MTGKKRKLVYLFMIPISALILTFIAYTKFYYGILNLKSIEVNFIVCCNIILKILLRIIDNLTASLLTENNVKIIIIAIAIIFIIHKIELKEILYGITNLEVGTFKLQREVEILNNLNKREVEKVEKLQEENNTDENEKKIQLSKQKIKLLEIMINEPYVVAILERFLNKKMGNLTIPMNVFKQNTSLDAIGEIFDYEAKVNSVKIIGIKESIKNLVYEIYIGLKNEKD